MGNFLTTSLFIKKRPLVLFENFLARIKFNLGNYKETSIRKIIKLINVVILKKNDKTVKPYITEREL